MSLKALFEWLYIQLQSDKTFFKTRVTFEGVREALILVEGFFPPSFPVWVSVVKDDTGTLVLSFNTKSVRKTGAFYPELYFYN